MGSSANKRGTFIVLEGTDRVGKTTQCLKLTEALQRSGPVEMISFPDRTTAIGQLIGSYLETRIDVDDHAIHLLFSANRWELAPLMKRKLESGITLIVDRYAFSGVAYTRAKPGFTADWCANTDAGLPKPDLVIFLHASPTLAAARAQFGTERYENTRFQTLVRRQFMRMIEEDSSVNWKTVDASRTVDVVHDDIMQHSIAAINATMSLSPGQLWML